MIDPTDPDFPDEPHLDPDELNDLGGDYDLAITFLNDLDKGVVGLNKPRVVHIRIPEDKHSYQRSKAAQRFGMSERELPDEPDHMRVDEQGYE